MEVVTNKSYALKDEILKATDMVKGTQSRSASLSSLSW